MKALIIYKHKMKALIIYNKYPTLSKSSAFKIIKNYCNIWIRNNF